MLPAPKNIKAYAIDERNATIEWGSVLKCCSYPGESLGYCACDFQVRLKGITRTVSAPSTYIEFDDLIPGTKYTVEVQTVPTSDIYKRDSASRKVKITFTTKGAAPEVLAPEVLAPEVLAPEVLAPEVLAPEVLAPEVLAPEAAPTLWSSRGRPELLTIHQFIDNLNKNGEIDLAQLSKDQGDNKWFQRDGQVIYRIDRCNTLTIRHLPPTALFDVDFLKDGHMVTRVLKTWALARISELPFIKDTLGELIAIVLEYKGKKDIGFMPTLDDIIALVQSHNKSP